MTTRKAAGHGKPKDGDESAAPDTFPEHVEAGVSESAGYHGEDAADRGVVHDRRDVASFGEHTGLDGATAPVEAATVDTDD